MFLLSGDESRTRLVHPTNARGRQDHLLQLGAKNFKKLAFSLFTRFEFESSFVEKTIHISSGDFIRLSGSTVSRRGGDAFLEGANKTT
jgi:hypothetical protein